MDTANLTTQDVVSRWSTWELLGQPYLDTEMPEYSQACKAELQSRGIVGVKLLTMKLIAAGGFCWNLLWWEWVNLSGRDVVFGWISNLILVSVILAAFWIHWVFGIVVLCTLTPILFRLFKFATAVMAHDT